MTSTLPHVLHLSLLLFLSIQVGDRLYFVLAVSVFFFFCLLLTPEEEEEGGRGGKPSAPVCLSVCFLNKHSSFVTKGVDFVCLNTFGESERLAGGVFFARLVLVLLPRLGGISPGEIGSWGS